MLQMVKYTILGLIMDSSSIGPQLIYNEMLIIPRLSLVILDSDLLLIFLVGEFLVAESLKSLQTKISSENLMNIVKSNYLLWINWRLIPNYILLPA